MDKINNKIPKIIHYVWLGNNKKDKKTIECIKSWKKYCPDYQLMEWGNDILKEIDNQYAKEAYQNKMYAFVSDYIRLYVLKKYGGIYLDTDVEITNSIDKFLDNGKEFFLCQEIYHNKININTAFIGSVPNNHIVSYLLDTYKRESFIKSDKRFNMSPNPQRFLDYFKKQYGITLSTGLNTIDLGNDGIIYPYYYFCHPEEYNENYAIHHFAASWLKDRYTFLQTIFSIKNSRTKSYKEITILGLKFKIRLKKNGLEEMIEGLQNDVISLKRQCNEIRNVQKRGFKQKEYSNKIGFDVSQLEQNFQQNQDNNEKEVLPKISVLMSVYNTKEEYLKESIESILNQTFTNFEFIIIDDGSTNENTINTLKHYINMDNRLKIFFEEHSGLANTRNKLLDKAQCEYCAIMDSDDVSLAKRFEKQVQFLDNNPSISILGSWFYIFTENIIIKHPIEPKYMDFLMSNSIGNPTVMFRKSDFLKYNLRYDVNYPCEDYELWSRAIRYLNFYNLQEVLLKYRWHGTNSSIPTEFYQNQVRNVQQNMLDFLTDDKELQQKIMDIVSPKPTQKIKYTFLERIFSVKNQIENGITRKVICVLGIKIKIQNTQKPKL